MSDAKGKEVVGVVGVGRMGLAMVNHLVRHGHDVIAYDIYDSNLAKARAFGARTAVNLEKVGADATFVIIGVGYDAEVNEVALGARGLLSSLSPGSIIAVSSTVLPDTVQSLAKAAAKCNIGVLDAPICRGRWFAD